MKRTPLHDRHVGLGAKIVEFAGWEMPLYYSGIVREVEAVRHHAGIFDLSHMGEVFISGRGGLDLIQYVTTNDAGALDIGRAQYTLMCDEHGGIIDDLIVYRLDQDDYMLVVNASNTDSDFAWMESHNQCGAHSENLSDEIGIIAVQGPKSQEILQQFVDFDLGTLRRFAVVRAGVGEAEAWIARTGYTGEDGFEVYCHNSDCVDIWDRAMHAGKPLGMEPAGLGARDVLRLESAYPLYGNELTLQTNPVDAHLLWVVQFNKGDFLGKEGILRARELGPRKVLAGLSTDQRCIPRHDQQVVVDGTLIGHVTSGTFSPTLGKAIALAYLEPRYAEIGNHVEVDIRGKLCACEVVPTPFYRVKKPVAGTTSVQ
jgi:aminomethyltransferase